VSAGRGGSVENSGGLAAERGLVRTVAAVLPCAVRMAAGAVGPPTVAAWPGIGTPAAERGLCGEFWRGGRPRQSRTWFFIQGYHRGYCFFSRCLQTVAHCASVTHLLKVATGRPSKEDNGYCGGERPVGRPWSLRGGWRWLYG